MSLTKVSKLFDGPQDIGLKDLVLDPNNVRFKHLPSQMTDKQIEEWLLDEQDVRQLIKQILRVGYLEQPIFVVEESGKYIVKEGNRRTVALREISRQIITGKIKKFDRGHFDIVPVMVLSGTEKEIDLFLGTIHVSGPKEWAAANKAGHIYDLIESHSETFESVAEYLAMTKREVMNYYFASQATQTYGKRFPEDKNYLHKFSFFAELYGSRVLRTWIDEDPSNLDKFIELVANKKFSVTYRDVRKFAKIIAIQEPKCSQALAILDQEDGNVEKAYDFITESSSGNSSTWKRIEGIYKSLKEMTYEEYSEAAKDPQKKFLLDDLAKLTSKMNQDFLKLHEERN
jgi:hypothetical protein